MFAFSIILPSQAQAAGLKYGQPCKKAGVEQVYDHITFVCLKVKKKLVWTGKQIGEMPKTNTVISISLPKTFQNLNNSNEIIYDSWFSAREKIKKSSENLNNIFIFVGSNTTTGYENPKRIYSEVSKLYSNFPQVKNLYSIHLSFLDISWAQDIYNKYQDGYSWNGPTVAVDTCPTVSCEMGNAYRTKNGDGILVIGESQNWNNTGMPAYSTSSGEVYAHEYTHTIQMFNSNNKYWLAPIFLLEGQALWSQKVSIYKDYPEYLKNRKIDLLNLYNEKNKYTKEYIYNYLNASSFESYNRWDAYAIGFMVNEILSYLKGPDSVMNIYKNIGDEYSFKESFQKEFGTSWDEALPYISQAIYKELNA